jgi:hypothetical protein
MELHDIEDIVQTELHIYIAKRRVDGDIFKTIRSSKSQPRPTRFSIVKRRFSNRNTQALYYGSQRVGSN